MKTKQLLRENVISVGFEIKGSDLLLLWKGTRIPLLE